MASPSNTSSSSLSSPSPPALLPTTSAPPPPPFRALYPPPHPSSLSSPRARALLIARHSPCASTGCTGFRPASGVQVELKGEGEGEGKFVDVCVCGRAWGDHGGQGELDGEELVRRAKVALRLDELLQDKDKLLDFTYTDSDILSLRKQMRPYPSSPSAAPSPPSSDDTPLAHASASTPSTSAPTNPKRRAFPSRSPSSASPKRRRLDLPVPGANEGHGAGHGKTTVSGKAPAHVVPSASPAPSSTPLPPAPLKTEPTPVDIDALASGISLDPSSPAPPLSAPPRKARPAILEESQNLIQFRVVRNDPTLPPQERAANLVLLTGLKNIFQKQLPKMPREYIARLVYDRNHLSMAIVKRGLVVRGGITWRPFESRRFAEIVFCAITSSEQVKGYGSHLMNHLKDHVKATSRITHFLTYADNYAVGYFKKQGFTKEISLPREVWTGYIKDYEGGTLMQCHMLPKIKYLKAQEMLAAQKEAVLHKIRKHSRSHIVHPGLAVFRPAGAGAAEPGNVKLSAGNVPGLRESGWTPEMDELARRPQRNPDHAIMHHLLSDMQNHASSWAFQNPVNKDEVPDYYDVITEPMDLSTMEHRLENNAYANLDAFLADANKIFANCRKYNGESSSYSKNANKLEKYLEERVELWKGS